MIIILCIDASIIKGVSPGPTRAVMINFARAGKRRPSCARSAPLRVNKSDLAQLIYEHNLQSSVYVSFTSSTMRLVRLNSFDNERSGISGNVSMGGSHGD